MQKWEYMIINFRDYSHYTMNGKRVDFQPDLKEEDTFQELKYLVLSELGMQGWELVTGDPGLYIFKRPKLG